MGKPSKETGPEPVVIATGGEVDGTFRAEQCAVWFGQYRHPGVMFFGSKSGWL